MYRITLLCLLMGLFLTTYGQKKMESSTGLAPKVHTAKIMLAPTDVMDVYPQSATFWTGNTEGTTKTDGEINTVFPNVGWAVFDLSTLPAGTLVTGLTYYGFVNSTSFPYWSGTPMGTVNPITDDAATINAQIQANYGSGVAYIYSQTNITTGWFSSPLGNGAVADFQAALAQGWFAMGFVDWDFSPSWWVNFDGWNGANPPYIEVSYILAVPHDVATESIDMPGIVPPGTMTPYATVFNYSDVTENFDVTMTIGSYSSTKNVTVASLTAQQVAFDDWNATLGDYSIDVCTQLGTDPNPNNDCLSQPISVQNVVPVYGYNAYDPGGMPQGPVQFLETDPSNPTLIAPTTSADFICAGTAGAGGTWYGLQYGAGFQPLYTLDPITGAMAMVGTTNVSSSINGCAWDPTTGNYYAIGYSPNNLYTIDVNTGNCTLVGASDPNPLFISLACSPSGQLYALDIISDNLYTIDKTTGAATVVGYVGIDANYAQDMGFDQNSGVLFWASFNLGTFLGEWRTIDPTTGMSTYIGTIGPAGMEICSLCLPWQVIPVEFTAFNANVNEGNVVLNWTTATEKNNQGFEVQKNSGNGFEAVGFVQGNGTSTQIHSYTYVDKNAGEGNYTYRLRQVDFDGTSNYSKTVEVKVELPKVYSLAQNYPNPFNPSTQINFSLAADSKVTLKVFDILGQEVAKLLNGNITAGTHNIMFDASHLNSGVYLYKIEATGVDGSTFTSVKKMILTK